MDKKQALSKCMTLCSRQEHCSSDIKDKLKRWGVSDQESSVILKELINQKYLDDLRFSEAYVKDKLRFNGWGRVKIRYMLSMKKIEKTTIEKALESIDEDLYTEILNNQLQKKQKQLKGETDEWIKNQKLIRYLQAHGFELYEIQKSLKRPLK